MGLFDDKVIWITGGGDRHRTGRCRDVRGRGRGGRINGAPAREARGDQAAVESGHGRAHVVPLDVGDRTAVDRAAAELLGELGRVDVLVNNAGTNVPGEGRRMENLTAEDFDDVIRINLTGQYNLFRAAFAPMRAQGEGLVINVISTAAKAPSGVAGMAYQTSKFGQMGFGVSLNREAWKFGIRNCNLYPDETNTEIIQRRPVQYSEAELERILQPEDFAHAMKFVASLHPRASVTDLTLYPTMPKVYSSAETGLP